ncbi:MAG TPA: hypothetical protein VGK02_09470 [Candidatus Aquicultor sp.]
MKKSLVVLMTTGLVLTAASSAYARTEANSDSTLPSKGNIVAETSTVVGALGAAKDWNYYELGTTTVNGVANYAAYQGNTTSTHPYGTWNSPYTLGIDGYNYNDSQDYVNVPQQVGIGDHVQYPINSGFVTAMTAMLPPGMVKDGSGMYAGMKVVEATLTATFQSGPHGGYVTSTHRCRECHAVHRAAGKFKLLRSDTRFEACDWCHGTGAGSGFNIVMDNNDSYTKEYNVGHTMGYGIDNGKWRAPDDTYPAYAPNYYMGGFSCFDCHSPHANPARLMGYDSNAKPIQAIVDLFSGNVFNMGNPGHDMFTSGGSGYAVTDMAAGKLAWVPSLGGPLPNKAKPYYLAGSWLLLKNPDKEIASRGYSNVPVDVWTFGPDVQGHYNQGPTKDATYSVIATDTEIPDDVTMALNEFSSNVAYPINKMPINWNTPIGSAAILATTNMFGFAQGGTTVTAEGTFTADNYGYNIRNPFCHSLLVDEFCTDCHDGNAGLSTIAAPLFSEDRALRGQTAVTVKTDDGSTYTVNGTATNWKGSYDIAYGHDVNSRH